MTTRWDQSVLREPRTGLVLDLTDAPRWTGDSCEAALSAMAAIEGGAVANIDEQRQVGHYWLRAPQLAPDPSQTAAIRDAWARIDALDTDGFDHVLWIGIGGSALGPQLLAGCLAGPAEPTLSFLDNTDPEGFARTLGGLKPASTRVVVVSKSGGTVETRNAMLAAQAHWARAGVRFGPCAIAITGEGSRLHLEATHAADPWRAVLPVWDWVGGRTSVTGPVGLTLMKLMGWDWKALVAGAAAADVATRSRGEDNPALALARAWHTAGNGRGDRALVVLPYRDRLHLVGRYLQQLIMESIGKRTDRTGAVVHQGLTVYGNKGSTDQHAFVQQVRDGRDDCFVHFVETTAQGPRIASDGGTFADDHLLGFLLGTRAALRQAQRPSLTLRLPDTSARSLGALIALFERATGLYAELVGINAYDQPGVEAGKLAAKGALSALSTVAQALAAEGQTAGQLARALDLDAVLVWRLLEQLAATGRSQVVKGKRPAEDRYSTP